MAAGRGRNRSAAWASGQALGSGAGGALAQVTSDLVPYALIGAACLATLAVLRFRPRTAATRA